MDMSVQLHFPAALIQRKQLPLSGPRPGLEAVVKRNICSPRRDSNPDRYTD